MTVSQQIKEAFADYLVGLRQTTLDEKTEATNRTDLEDLLNALTPDAGIKIIQEASRANSQNAKSGTPDFTIKKGALILGYVENKPIGTNITDTAKSEQIQKYQSLSDNILITNYCDWILLGKDGAMQKAEPIHT